MSADSCVSLWLSRHISSLYTPTSPTQFDERAKKWSVPSLRATPHSTLQQHGCVMCSASTCHVASVRLSIDSPHQGLVSCLTPEYQCFLFEIYRASNFTAWQLLRWHSTELSRPSTPGMRSSTSYFLQSR